MANKPDPSTIPVAARKQMTRVRPGVYEDKFLDITIRNTRMAEKGLDVAPAGKNKLGDWEVDIGNGAAKCYVSTYVEARNVVLAIRGICVARPVYVPNHKHSS